LNNSTRSGVVFDLEASHTRLNEIEKEISKPGAWDRPELMTPFLQEKSRLAAQVAEWEALRTARQDLDEWLAFAKEEQTQEVLGTLKEQLETLTDRLKDTELGLLLAAPEDAASAILEIHPGAGGTESQDWAEMLMRLYRRWADRHEYKVTVLDFLPADEAGVKSVTLQIAGRNAYGLLRSEAGIHRLIRISPFDASGRRHTSFASVDVYPDVEQEIEIELKEEELRIDVFRSSGPGGQSVNTTSSAVRVTHLPTGVAAQCQNEKSQLRNKETAIKILKARLYELELKKLEEEKKAQYASKDAIAWGSQIRTYTLQPYRLVKDHRTNAEVGDVDAVLDGAIDKFIREFLLYAHSQKKG
jgi:peptide chain release factor 2